MANRFHNFFLLFQAEAEVIDDERSVLHTEGGAVCEGGRHGGSRMYGLRGYARRALAQEQREEWRTQLDRWNQSGGP